MLLIFILQQALNAELIEYKPHVEEVKSQRLETSALGLIFEVMPQHIGIGLKLECTASIGSVRNKGRRLSMDVIFAIRHSRAKALFPAFYLAYFSILYYNTYPTDQNSDWNAGGSFFLGKQFELQLDDD